MSYKAKYKIDCSVVIPVYNSQKTLKNLITRISQAASSSGKKFEVILVDDGSKDRSFQILKDLAPKFDVIDIIIIKLSRNFGQHNALLCGISQSRGNYVSTIDDDLQQSPEDLTRLLVEISKSGRDLFYGIYDRQKQVFYRRIGSDIFDLIVRLITRQPIKICSMRIFSQKIARKISLNKNPSVNVDAFMYALPGKLKIGGLGICHFHRMQGKSNYNLKKLIRFAINFFRGYRIVKNSRIKQYEISEILRNF